MGIRDHLISPSSPWQNGHAERLIGSIWRESLDHVIVFSEAHLRRILKAYASYYNQVRTHLSLHKDAPDVRRAQSVGTVAAVPAPGRLHHHYVRVSVFSKHSRPKSSAKCRGVHHQEEMDR
jgi:Integrase core domain